MWKYSNVFSYVTASTKGAGGWGRTVKPTSKGGGGGGHEQTKKFRKTDLDGSLYVHVHTTGTFYT
jgi:hypothetical protein